MAAIGRYVIYSYWGRVHGRGVSRARPELDRPVAIKVMLHSTPDFVARFRREAQAIARLTHGNIVQVFDFGVDDEATLLRDGARRGHAARRVVRSAGACWPREAVDIVGRPPTARRRAPRRHRPPRRQAVEPHRRRARRVKLVDFGIARDAGGGAADQRARSWARPGYMAPEQAQGKTVDHRADVYALGPHLFEMLPGEPPFPPPTIRSRSWS